MKIRKPSLPAIGAAYSVIALGAVAIIPKSAPAWLWTTVQMALLIWLMAAAAVGAVLWERYGPKGCRLHEFEAARAAREVHDANDIQVLGAFLSDDESGAR